MVKHNETGFIIEKEPMQLAEKLEVLIIILNLKKLGKEGQINLIKNIL